MPPPWILETPRLYIRHWQPTDDLPFAQLNADPEVMRYLPSLLTREKSDQLRAQIVQNIENSGIGFWALEVKRTKQFIGFTGIANVPEGKLPCAPTVEIGWRLARQAWGHGYASEAAQKLLQYAFEVLYLAEIVAFTAVTNQRSRAVMERIGMSYRPSDDFGHPALAEGHPLKPHVLYRIKGGHN